LQLAKEGLQALMPEKYVSFFHNIVPEYLTPRRVTAEKFLQIQKSICGADEEIRTPDRPRANRLTSQSDSRPTHYCVLGVEDHSATSALLI
jgi:hypothetical protein